MCERFRFIHISKTAAWLTNLRHTGVMEMFSIKQNAVWKNWSESVVAKPKRIVRPKTLGQLIALVKECRENNCTLRVVGAGHSFTPLAATDEVLVSLDHLNGIDAIDHENRLVTFWAGTRLKDVSRLLDERGYALENLGDINEQSIAGAISTGTHGTGIRFQSIPNQVEKLTLLTAHGELLEIGREQNDAYFEAARVSLGMLGIIVKVTLKVVPQYVFFAKNYRLSLEEGFQQLNALKEANRNVEFFWFPYTDVIQVKTLNEADEKAASFSNRFMSKVVMENGLFYLLSEMSRNAPKTANSSVKYPLGASGRANRTTKVICNMPRRGSSNSTRWNMPCRKNIWKRSSANWTTCCKSKTSPFIFRSNAATSKAIRFGSAHRMKEIPRTSASICTKGWNCIIILMPPRKYFCTTTAGRIGGKCIR